MKADIGKLIVNPSPRMTVAIMDVDQNSCLDNQAHSARLQSILAKLSATGRTVSLKGSMSRVSH